MKPPKIFVVLSEQWTLANPRDLSGLVDMAIEAENAGIDGVMLGGHVVMGANSAVNGLNENPREFLHIGNHPPMYPHPDNLMLLSAMAAATSRIKLMAGAICFPHRHPLLLAKELATLDLISRGRLIIIPTVSWQKEEYEALGVSWEKRGKILDEDLEILQRLWCDGSPVSYEGEHYQFQNVYVEPAPWSPGGPDLWFGGDGFTKRLVRRTVRYGKGVWPVQHLTPEEMDILAYAMKEAGRSIDDLDFGAILRTGEFKGADDLLSLDLSFEPFQKLYSDGITTFLIKPNLFIDKMSDFGDLCRTVRGKADELSKI